MDNSASWAPRPALIIVGWLGTAFALAGVFSYPEHRGQVLFGVAAFALAAASAHGTLFRPRLAADRQGIRIRRTLGQVRLAWPETRTRLTTTRRLGRDSVTLEIESGDQLFVFGWLELGADPREVLDVLSALRS
ncbi:PH domain-containing protein [Amycolatopsis taiwanensis]|uniref:Low molecular weight protein antigen 6 PH domain-containing protein n=1 Tax=Amycolatopsis taiwanensis TaxID=342230 RepID=A0A9W6R2J1_9PSEU|nr:PH domain-containing protein [Amycolatopsis taiwanensis]GLY67591.1 hypothetical protein Atai01_42100 [Amycolatopsis taiwanensis]